MPTEVMVEKQRRSTFKEKYNWLVANREFIAKETLSRVFEQMRAEGLYAETYSFNDAYRTLDRRIQEVLSGKMTYK